MKALVLAPRARYERFAPDLPVRRETELIFCDREGTEAEWLAAGGDADILLVTPVTPIGESLLSQMPNLKMIQSEGVGFDRIDLEATRKRNIYVCNNAGCNAEAVAELAVMMMTMLLHRTLWGIDMVRQGRQGQAVKALETELPPDLSVSTVGLVGFGAIAQATAKKLKAFGSKVYYYAPHRRDAETEAACGVEYLPLWELAARCDIVSLHMPANPETRHMVNGDFLKTMKPGSFLVNTARGAVIDDEALCGAIRSGHLAGAALDAYEPEPIGVDHPLVQLAKEFPERMVLCPHQGGLSRSVFRKGHKMMFENLARMMAGERPRNIVNGL